MRNTLVSLKIIKKYSVLLRKTEKKIVHLLILFLKRFVKLTIYVTVETKTKETLTEMK